MLTQDALAKAKALEVQVQAATFTKLEHDLSEDAAALRAWAKAEETRLSSVDAMVLNHKRRRYVQGLAKVREFSEERLRVRQCQPSELEVAARQLPEKHVRELASQPWQQARSETYNLGTCRLNKSSFKICCAPHPLN